MPVNGRGKRQGSALLEAGRFYGTVLAKPGPWKTARDAKQVTTGPAIEAPSPNRVLL